ncbi:MAG: FecR domain-containing protein [Tannerellaceae bacterium]|nr:FecR domain-containing protein [Tannerellaceae bacterium]
MDEMENKIDETWLIRYIRNKLTTPEREQVETWINSSEENQKTVRDLFYFSVANSTVSCIKKTSPEKALKKVSKRIRKNAKAKFFLYCQRVAAILFLPLLMFTGYQVIESYQTEEPHFYLEARMTPGMIGSLVLPDGTKVWLNSSTYLKYPNSFEGDLREITVDGEAYFQVAHDETKPFLVHTPHSSIRVLGTEFNVDAYSNKEFVITTLVEGAVEFSFPDINNRRQTLRMEPNEQIYYDKQKQQAYKQETYVAKDIAWIHGEIVLKDTPLSEVLWIMEKRFNVEFKIKNASHFNYSFTGIFTNQHIERVLEYFKRSSHIQYRIDHHHEEDGGTVRTLVELY